MRPSSLIVPAVVLLLGVLGAPARADVRVLQSDASGITLRVDVPKDSLVPGGTPDRTWIEVPGMNAAGPPGRPRLPYVATQIALPPGAGAQVRVVGGDPEEVREDVHLEIVPKPGFRPDGEGHDWVPTLEAAEPLTDGAWPRSPVDLGTPFTIRRNRLVSLRVTPYRYDEASGRLWVRRSLTVRVDFTGTSAATGTGAAQPDRHWDPVLREAVINFDQATRWRLPRTAARRTAAPERAAAPAGTPGFDEDELEVRVQLDTTGVYALEYDRLAAVGFPADIPIGEVSVHRHEFLEDAMPPYETIELPIEVDDRNGNGVFDSGDRILLFVQSWAERSRASFAQRAWGDGEVVYVTWLPGRTGARVPSRAGWRDFLVSPLKSYPRSERWEKNLYYMLAYYIPDNADTNTDLFQWTEYIKYSPPDSFPFQVYDLDTTRSVRLTVGWQGRKFGNHITWAHVRNGRGEDTAIADSTVWSGFRALQSTATMYGSAFSNGRNVLRLWGKISDTENIITYVGLDWFDTEYWRSFRALNGYLPCSSGDATGDYEIDATGFTTRDIQVWDVSDSLAPLRLEIADSLVTPAFGGYKVRFQDQSPTGARHHYVVFDEPRTPAADRYHPVPQPRRNLWASGAGDYLLIVPEAFLSTVQPLVDMHEAQGLHVVVAPLETVNDEFNGGRKSSYSIRRFARYALNNWDARFMLLVGDGSEDPQNFLSNSGLDWIPIQKVPGPISPGNGIKEPIPSDNWFTWCLNCTNMNPRGAVPDIYVGRLPVNSATEAAAVVEKLVAYDEFSPDQLWRRRMFLLSDDQYSTISFFGGGNPGSPSYCWRYYEQVFLQITQALRDVVLNGAGLRQSDVEVYNLEYELRNEPVVIGGPGDTCRVSWNDTQSRAHLSITPQILQRLNQGRLWWNFQGHANQYVLTHEDIWVNRGSEDDAYLLANDGMPFFFSAFSCHPNGFAVVSEQAPNRGPSIGEELVTLPRGGAIASWASSGYEILPTQIGDHLNVIMAKSLFQNPPRDEYLGDRGSRVVLGEAIAQTLLLNTRTALLDSENQVGISYVLLGDPATRISIGPPQFFVTANGQQVTNGEPVDLTSASDTLRLEADLASNVRLDSIWVERTEGTGVGVVPDSSYTLTPAFPDTGAGGSGGRRYHLSYLTTLAVASQRYTIRVVDRWGVPGRFDVVFPFTTVLRSAGQPLRDGDVVPATADLSMLVVSPGTLSADDFVLEVDGVPQAVTAAFAGTDTTGRRWVLGWSHAPYSQGDHTVHLSVAAAVSVDHVFGVESGTRLENVLTFPNPFDDERGTAFSFYLIGDAPADVLIRVYTVSGRLIYEHKERGIQPGYQQIPWDGRDAEGQKLANGVYFYRLIARSGSKNVVHEGRLVKLRKPRRAVEPANGP